MQDQDIIDSSGKPEVLRRQVVPVPLPGAITRRRHSDRWLFVRCTSLTAAAIRLIGWRGVDHRIAAMRQLCREYFRVNGRGVFAGVAMLSPDGSIVAAYYGPSHEHNTPLDATSYLATMRVRTQEELVPISKRTVADKRDGLMPLAARTDRPRFE